MNTPVSTPVVTSVVTPVVIPEFMKFPKMARLHGPLFITEKIDGTNAQILFQSDGTWFAGSRTRWLSEKDDNFGFYKWVAERAKSLFAIFGEGRFYGEFWGKGIQRGYGLDHKRFSIFNTTTWNTFTADRQYVLNLMNIHCVPLLHTCEWNTFDINMVFDALKTTGSRAAPGFMNPEGIVIFDSASGATFKKTYEYDLYGKGKPKDSHGNSI